MAPRPGASERLSRTRNTARFFTENRHIAWVLLVATLLWGVYAYFAMPQRKDPEIPVREAVVLCPWPGASALQVEDLVSRKIEQQIAQNDALQTLESVSRSGISIVYVTLQEEVEETGREFDDIDLKLRELQDLPEGAGPVVFLKDFGDTAALTLTVASPKVGGVELALRARDVRQAIEQVRQQAPPDKASPRVTLGVAFPASIGTRLVRRYPAMFMEFARGQGLVQDMRLVERPGFIGVDAYSREPDPALLAYVQDFIRERLRGSEFHPDTWPPVVIRDPAETEARLTAVAGDRYSYRELDDFTDLIQRTLQSIPLVSKVTRAGVLEERVFLEYSQARLASYGLEPAQLGTVLEARNIEMPGGVFDVEGRSLPIRPTGQFTSEQQIGGVVIATSSTGSPVYLRDLVDIVRSYETPPRFLNYYGWKDKNSQWQRSRAVTLAIQMRAGMQIAEFGAAVDAALLGLKPRLPEDLILARVSDQPQQVEEKVDLFMRSLYEAIILVVLVSALGFREWRSALLMALSIPITLAMTFGLMQLLSVDLQQVSIASLILALGLLVDDPVVAGDAIKREIEAGQPRALAAWLGPTKLARAILFATITNIVAYLPFLILSGDVGRFLYTLPVVVTCALVASRLVSMTFVPLLGYHLLRAGKDREISFKQHRTTGPPERPPGMPSGLYGRTAAFAIRYRWAVLAASLLLLGAGGFFLNRLQPSFFPNDLSYLFYVDVWLPEDAPLSATNRIAAQAERIIERVAQDYARQDGQGAGREGTRPVLQSISTFVGGGGPRFWFSVKPEQHQLNYAQLIVRVHDSRDTARLIAPLQHALAANVVGARVDVRQLETGKPVGIPLSLRLSGEDIAALRGLAEQFQDLLRAVPEAARVRDNWGAQGFSLVLDVKPDRANLAGITNRDVALSVAAAVSGVPITTLREGDKRIPVVARLRPQERARLTDLSSLYVYGAEGGEKVPLQQVADISYRMQEGRIYRRNQFRTIVVSAFPIPGVLPSQVFEAVEPRLAAFAQGLPPGYRLEIAGEQEEQVKGFKELAVVMAISVAAIFLALVVQFRHAVKPFIVFAAIPYGIVGALAALWVMGAPFGFMAFLGIASLIGVIVSHIIVLFDFIEERREQGSPLEEALLDAGTLRLRPVMITVGATVIALVPLALHGGPLWQPLCYAQIGGLTLATFGTLLLVPVLYAIFVRDLKLIRWESDAGEADDIKR